VNQPQPLAAAPDRFPEHEDVGDFALLPAAPVASVVINTYLHEPYLAQCVDSIASQVADFPFEIVISEDNSPDGTRRVALELQRKYPHLVRVVSTPENKGGALNTIFSVGRARGEFIAFCEGDDFWIDDDKLARQVAAFRRFPQVDMAFTRGFRLYSDGTRVREWDYGDEERIIPAPELFATLGWIAPTASLAFRTETLRRLPSWYGDHIFGDPVIILAGSVRGGAYYEPRETICYRIAHATSFTANLEAASREKRIEFLKVAIDVTKLNCAYYDFPLRHVSHRVNDYRLSLGKLLIAEGRRLEGLRTLAAIGPAFLARGLGRRVARRLRPARAEPAGAGGAA
jgi:glycosyltransferase involved in cell wall biosynthesis